MHENCLLQYSLRVMKALLFVVPLERGEEERERF
jgi:hypothetical protein